MRLLPERLEAPAAGIASVINGSLVAARKHGGQILLRPGAYFGRVFLPLLVSWLAGLGVTAVFLHAYAIPLTFHIPVTRKTHHQSARGVQKLGRVKREPC
jgi:hypothetical protein